jgi:hypothetical protein
MIDIWEVFLLVLEMKGLVAKKEVLEEMRRLMVNDKERKV